MKQLSCWPKHSGNTARPLSVSELERDPRNLWLCSFTVSKNSCFNFQWSLFWKDSKRSFSLSVCGNWNSQRLLSKIKLRMIRISWRATPLAVLQWEARMTQLLFESAGESNQSMRDIVAILLWLACLHLCFIGKRSKCMNKLFTGPCWRKKCVECILDYRTSTCLPQPLLCTFPFHIHPAIGCSRKMVDPMHLAGPLALLLPFVHAVLNTSLRNGKVVEFLKKCMAFVLFVCSCFNKLVDWKDLAGTAPFQTWC